MSRCQVGALIFSLQVEERAVADGDTITVYVDVYKDARETSYLPQAVVDAAKKRRTARAQHDNPTASAMQAIIQEAGYKCVSHVLTCWHFYHPL